MKMEFLSADLLKDPDRLSTGNINIDKILKGGFRSKILNEIVGAGGSGKTQMCLTLSLMVQLPREFGGLEAASVYICTEDVFPIKRLHEMNIWFEQIYGIENALDNVFISHIPDCGKLKTFLYSEMKYLAKFKKIGLIVIDSIGGLFRSDNLEICYDNRSKDFIEIAAHLRKLSSKLQCIVICCNQMTEDIGSGCSVPCLGLSWSNLVNSRFIIKRSQNSSRTFEVMFSPDLPPSKCNFFITNTGIS